MQSSRARDVQSNGYMQEVDQNIIGQPREQKFYSQAYDLDGQFASTTVPEGYIHDSGYHRSSDMMAPTHDYSNRTLNENQPLTSYNYAQSPHVPTTANSDHFTVPTHRGPFDPTGQQCPPGGKPRVSTTIWEDEGTLCFQVEANQMTVARREDNDMINGTKLLNVAQMSRGKRDGILKNEPQRAVIKVGSMHLKGVWIPFDRALELANKNHVTDMLYPLFVKDIKRFLYHPTNYARTTAVLAAANSRQAQQTQPPNGMVELMPEERISLDRSLSMPTPLDRSVSMLTPPSSASTNSDYWTETSSHGPISETHARTHSLPGTPATTPPAPAYFAQHVGAQKLYANAYHDVRPSVSGNHYGQQPDMQRSYNHSRTTSMVSYTEDDAAKDMGLAGPKDSYSTTQSHLTNHMQRPIPSNLDQSAYLQHMGPFNSRIPSSNEKLDPTKISTDARLTPSNTGHQRTHSRAHSKGSSKIFNTPNLTTQMGRRTNMTPGASPGSRQGNRQANRDPNAHPNETIPWVHQQQSMVYSTPQQSNRGHLRQLSGLPQIYEETPSCRMAYQLHGQGRLSEPFPRLAENGQSFQTPAGSPLRGPPTGDIAASPLNGKKKRERVVSDPDQYYQNSFSYEDRQESLTPPPISKKDDFEESPKRRRSERTGMHSRSGSVY